ncbi:uncharacterized protein METZ01_LOCUS68278, partial [marine metagenome]
MFGPDRLLHPQYGCYPTTYSTPCVMPCNQREKTKGSSAGWQPSRVLKCQQRGKFLSHRKIATAQRAEGQPRSAPLSQDLQLIARPPARFQSRGRKIPLQES